MNLMVVSEKHGLVIIGVYHELCVFNLDPVTLKIANNFKFKRISLQNEDVRFLI